MKMKRLKGRWTVRKLFRFEAAHRLASAYSKVCTDTVHGHSYRVEVFLSTDKMNKDNMVMDFGEVKKCVEPMLEAWDHAVMIPLSISNGHDNGVLGKKVFYTSGNPTAEWMAALLYSSIKHNGLPVSKVRVHETETGWAEYEEVRS